jgi:hypothetical protein
MKNKVVSGFGETYERLTKASARKAFEGGKMVYVMSIDRNPITSLTSPYIYYIGCKSLCGWFNGKTEINTFDELLEDFSVWLDTDGYGHNPQRYDAEHYRFSYWLKKE